MASQPAVERDLADATGLSLWLGAATAAPRHAVVEAESFVVRDARGKVRARLGLLLPGPGGLWSAAHGADEPQGVLTELSPGLLLYGADEKPRLEARALGTMAFLSVYGDTADAGGTFAVDNTGSGVSFFSGRRRALLNTGPLGARLTFEGDPGTGGVMLSDPGSLMLHDDKGQLRVMLAPDLRDPRTQKPASLVMLDPSGAPVFAAP